jgi:eukaryotic-like serine/threonine-protein kinase
VSASTTPSKPAPSEARYETLRTIGQGGTGTVYLARDRESGEFIALKKLSRMDPKSVLRVKREFRSLSDVHHRNLVELYDLGAGADGWFLTMEYVEGADLLTHLGCSTHASGDRDIAATREILPPNHRQGAARDLEPILSVFHQLASGIRALHQAGMLHRDLKPTNVLVSSGRVVVLDFGLVRGLDSDDRILTQDGLISGTPAYMAPEQAGDQPLGEPADWYAFGVMLYQVLSGALPIEGRTAVEIILRKTTNDPQPIERLVPRLPLELIELCNGLLQRDPARRPNGDHVLRVLDRLLGQPTTDVSRFTMDLSLTTQTVGRGQRAPAIVGRSAELEQLTAALDEAREGVAIVAHVRGTSGAGKTTLVQQFLASLEDDALGVSGAQPLTLRSRCNEREAMPYKALDGIMDSLVQSLMELNDFDLGRLLPVDIAELSQVFPVMQRVPSVKRLVETMKLRADALQARVRAEAALRDLFSRLASRRPIVLWIDDLQWGDLDSANILKAWRDQLAESPILLVFSYRTEEVETSPCLRALLDSPPPVRGAAAQDRIIDISALAQDDVRVLCERRLGAVAREHPELIGRIAGESQGNPFLVSQLAALVQAKIAHGDSDLDTLSIEQLVDQAFALLPAEATRLLKALAIAGRPLSPKLGLRAVGVSTEGRGLLHALRSLRLIRVRDVGSSQLIEVYHDRVREGVLASLTREERERVHGELLAVLEKQPDADAGWLHALALGAAQPMAALKHGLAAAEAAESALAFERAAELYGRCIELVGVAEEARNNLRMRYAECLARGGHGVRAADVYLEMAETVEPSLALRCRRLAASHLLRVGQLERGSAIARDVVKALGVSWPEGDAGLVAALVWERTRLGMRGLELAPRIEPLAPEVVEAIELYATLAIEYQPFQPLRAALFQCRMLRAALEAGEPQRAARAMLATALTNCVSGTAKAAREATELLERAEEIAKQLNVEALNGDVLASRAMCAYMLGRTHEVLEPASEAERIFRMTRLEAGGDFHRFVIASVRIATWIVYGQNDLAFEELERSLAEARAMNNQKAILQLSVPQTYAEALRNRPQQSKVRLLEERKQLPPDHFGPTHLLHALALMRASCSTNDFAWGEPWLEQAWSDWKRSPVRFVAFLSFHALSTRLRYLINRHVVERRTDSLEAVVKGELKAMAKLPFQDHCAAVIDRTKARLEFIAGRKSTAIELLRRAVDMLEKTGALADLARDRYALGVMIGGAEGAKLRMEAEQTLRGMGMTDPLAELSANYPELLREAFGS